MGDHCERLRPLKLPLAKQGLTPSQAGAAATLRIFMPSSGSCGGRGGPQSPRTCAKYPVHFFGSLAFPTGERPIGQQWSTCSALGRFQDQSLERSEMYCLCFELQRATHTQTFSREIDSSLVTQLGWAVLSILHALLFPQQRKEEGLQQQKSRHRGRLTEKQ